ncbi:MAG: TonB-dependent receptor [Acidobacteriaceae bacterium]|nr:TonB-dependent receptor [Acidobacteriaceae bacterium]
MLLRSTRKVRRLGHRLVVLSLFSSTGLFAQSADLSGIVVDPSKLAVPNAQVRVESASTAANRVVLSNREGLYSIPALPPGRYNITVEANGFKTIRQNDIVLDVDQEARLDFTLEIGNKQESIVVEGSAPLLNVSDGTVSTVVDRHFADNLPLNGRSFQTLIMLTPGVVVTATAFDDQGQFSVNGQRADANYFMVDGVSANFGVTGYPPLVQSGGGALPALAVSGGTNSLVSVDAMQEFRVQTSSFAPEFGRTPGGQISILTRSGTNDFHGTLFEYFRNNVLDARDWFVNFDNLPKPEERQNDFGGVFGGPIIKDKTFFFFSYEGLRLRQPATQETVVPDSASRQQAPTTMQPFLNAYPVQNGPELGSGFAQFNGSYSSPSSLDAYSIRIDQVINSKISLFGRYNYSPSSLDQRGAFGVPYIVLSTTEPVSSSVQTFTLGLNELITPRISNEIRANYSNDRVGTKFALDNFGGAVPLADSLLFPSGYSSANSEFEFLILGAGEIAQGRQAVDEQRQINLLDNLSWVKGSHQLKFGVDYRWLSPFTSIFTYAQFAEFTSMSTSVGGALSGKAALAIVDAYQSDTLVSQNFSLYGQDTWRITPRLTATYGLRWDINYPLKGINLANQPFTVTGLNNPATLALAPRGTPLYQTRYGNVAPRLGIAYQLSQKPNLASVLRGGFGIFYDLGYGSVGGASSYFPFEATRFMPGAAFPLTAQNAAPPAFRTNPPVPTINVADPHLKVPRTYEWNVALEQSLGNSQTLSLTYVGAAGRNLLRTTNFANPNPNFEFVGVTSNTATSNYQALQTKFERRLSRGLQVLASYTWSHSIDNASTDAFANYLNTPGFIGNPNIDRGSSDFDIRHAFTAGVTYSLPSPSGNQLAHAVLGGWSVDSFIFARTAPPVDLVGAITFATGTYLRYRPNLNPGIPLVLYGSGYPGGKIFNSAAFTPPPTGQQGDLGRNVLRGFGASQADIAIQRQFRLTEKVALRFRSEFFNIFNHPNFGPPDNTLTDALFGQSTQTLASSLGSGGANGGFNPLYQIGGPRSIQLALKLVF